MDNRSLYHHGIKGQKWGVRRFQKKDGTLTKAGKKRYSDYENEAKTMSDQELRSQINRMNLERRYVNASKARGSKSGRALDAVNKTAAIGNDAGKIAKDGYKMMDLDSTNVKVTGQGLNVVSKTAQGAKKVGNIAENKRVEKRAKTKLENMSDKDLQDLVTRMELEQQYSSLKQETVSRGKVSAMDVLEVVGSVVTIGASATALAVELYKLKNGK